MSSRKPPDETTLCPNERTAAGTMNQDPATLRWRVHPVTRELGEPESVVLERACSTLRVVPEDVLDWKIVKRSIDARGRRAPRFVHVVDVEVATRAVDRDHPPSGARLAPAPRVTERRRVHPDAARPIVIGMGPCGLFAALQLAEAGLRPILIDRGKPVETRAKDVGRLMGKGILDHDSNLCFGEGGAGTWSDGKLYTRVGGPLVSEVLASLVSFGAPERILVDGRPHLGTDRLVALLKSMRAGLVELGCELVFDARVVGFEKNVDTITGVRLLDGRVIHGSHVVLAVGHSARDLYRLMSYERVAMVPKPFAVGFRIEHPQALIDEAQYGAWATHEDLPAANYELATRVQDGPRERGVYSFCMCPGGSVVPTPTDDGELCINGMSHAARSGHNANSAIVVTVEPSDLASFAEDDSETSKTLAGMTFQRHVEATAWTLGGGAFVAPAQRASDFLAETPSADSRRSSYRRGTRATDLAPCYPAWINDALRHALHDFEKRLPGYTSRDATLLGVETRTSAPVTVTRDIVTLQSTTHPRLYPAGEGAGYGGGIVSAAIDGLRVAHAILDSLA